MQTLLIAPLLALALQTQDSTLARGVRLYEEGNVNEAAKVFKKAVEADPKSVEAHVWLGRAYLLQVVTASFIKKPIIASNARGALDKAVALDPRHVGAREARTTYYLNAPGIAGGGVDKARAEAATLEQINSYRGGLLLGRILERTKDYAAAEAKYRSLMTVFPDSTAPAAAVASLYQTQQRWADAFTLIDGWLAKSPNDPMMNFQLGRAAALSGERLADGEAALNLFLNRPGKGKTNDAPGHFRLGMILERNGDIAGAMVRYETAHRLDPHNEEAEAAFKRLTQKK